MPLDKVTVFSARKLWGDAGNGGKALTTAFVAGDQLSAAGTGVVRVKFPCDIICKATVGGLAADYIELRLDWSPIAQTPTDFTTFPFIAQSGSVMTYSALQPRVSPATLGEHNLIFNVPIPCDLRVMALRSGGGATTTLELIGHAVDSTGGSIMASLGASGGGGSGALERFDGVGLDDGAGAPLTLTGNFQYGDWFAVEDADLLNLWIEKTGANNPDNVDISVQASRDLAGTEPYDIDLVNAVSGGFDSRSDGIIRITSFTATTPERLLVSAELRQTGLFYRVGARFVGGTAPDVEIAAQAVHRG
jgi:hypothetical protein